MRRATRRVKKLRIVWRERFGETERFVESATGRLREEGAGNTEWLELGLRAALMADATEIIEALLNSPDLPVTQDAKRPGERHAGRHSKEVRTLFGTIVLERNYDYDARSYTGRFPLDVALGLHNGYSAGVARLMCRAGGRDSYEEGSGDLRAYAGIEVSVRQINRLVDETGPLLRKQLEEENAAGQTKAVPRMYISCDGTGVPMRKDELTKTRGKAADGIARTREVKTGCVFTQHPVDGEEPFRDSGSTSYIATMRRCDEFGLLLRKEAYRRGMTEKCGSRVFNAAVLIGKNGELLCLHRKLNELDIGHEFYAQGDRLGVVPTELGTVGVMVCADGFARGQVLSRSLCYMGADVILAPSAWAVRPDHDNASNPYGEEWRSAFKPVARDFSVWIAAVSNVGPMDAGPWSGRKCIGCSLVIDPEGKEAVVGPYGEDAETILYLDVEPKVRPARGCGWMDHWRSQGRA